MSKTKYLHEVAQPILTSEIFIICVDELLMFKRSETKEKFPGFWSIPGGHIDAGEDPLAAAIREVQEETGILLSSENMKLRTVAIHHHLDRSELYVAFSFVASIPKKCLVSIVPEEGSAHWMRIADTKTLPNVFEPIKYFFDHVLNDHPGILYTMSEWKHSKLVRVLSESIDSN